MKQRPYSLEKAPFLLCLALSAAMPLLAQTGPGWGLSFDGVDDFVSVPHRPELNVFPMTLSAWIKTSETNGVRMIASKYSPEAFNGYQLYLVNGQASARYFKDVSARLLSVFDDSEDLFVADGNWHHLALVVATNDSGFFIDGKAKGTWTWLGAPGACTNQSDLLLGREFRPYPPLDRYWRGLIDEIAIWNVARTRDELQTGLYQHLTGTEPGLLAAWQMDEGAGLAILDASPDHFDGHLINGPAWVKTDTPARGSALVFSGSGDHLRVPKFGLSAPTNDITVEFWLRRDSANEQVLFSLQPDLPANRIAVRIVPNDGEVYWEFGNSLAEGRLLDLSSNWLTGAWQHFALVSSKSENAMRIYRNGLLEVSKSGAENFVRGDYDFVIGGAAAQIDEFRIWSVARAAADIAAGMHRHLAGSEPALTAYWRFDEGAGELASDRSGSRLDGYFSNQTSWAASPIAFAPDTTTSAPSAIDLHDATLNGWISPNGLPTVAWFDWGTGPGYGQKVPLDAGLGGSPAALNSRLTGLSPGLTYHYRICASNSAGLSCASDQMFVAALPPTVNTLEPENIAGFFENVSATLHGSVIPNWGPATAWFEWGPNLLYGHRTPKVDVGNADMLAFVNQDLAGVPAGGIFHCRLVASNIAGTTFASDRAFWAPGITLNGSLTMSNECHTGFNDPGGGTTSPIVAIAAGAYHGLALTYDGTVLAWGAGSVNNTFPDFGQSMVPPLTDVVAIAAGDLYSVALRRDGSVVAWGINGYGQTNVPSGLSNVVAISAGAFFTLALKQDGSVEGWGSAPIAGGGPTFAVLEHITAISQGYLHSLELKADGTVVGVGLLDPVKVPPVLSNVVAISAGEFEDLALKQDGTVVAWNENGQATVPEGLSNVVAIAAGWSFSLALKSDGTVAAWGTPFYGETTPPAGLSNVVAISAGAESALALKADGTIVAWGYLSTSAEPTGALDFRSLARPLTINGAVETNTPGTYILIYTATNSLGSPATASRTVFVADTTPPLVRCPSDLSLQIGLEAGAPAAFEASAYDLCSGAVSITCAPPSGSTFPAGITTVHCVASDSSNNSASCAFRVAVLRPFDVHQGVLAQLETLRSSLPASHYCRGLDSAISDLTASLTPALWSDPSHLEPKHGDQAFNRQKDAVRELLSLSGQMPCGVSNSLLQTFLDRMVKADRLLALIAIQESAGSGRSNKVAEAWKELAAGDQGAAAGNFSSAIDHYRDAWKDGIRARAKMRLEWVNGRPRVECLVVPGETILFQASHNLLDWGTLGICTANTDGLASWEDTDGPRFNSRFYRATLLPP